MGKKKKPLHLEMQGLGIRGAASAVYSALGLRGALLRGVFALGAGLSLT